MCILCHDFGYTNRSTHNVVDLQNASNALGCLSNCRRGDEKRLEHIFLAYIRHVAFAHVNAVVFFAVCMLIAQLGNGDNRRKARVLGQRVGNNLERVGKRLKK